MRAGVCSSMISMAMTPMSASQSGGGIGVVSVTFSLLPSSRSANLLLIKKRKKRKGWPSEGLVDWESSDMEPLLLCDDFLLLQHGLPDVPPAVPRYPLV